jgi:hypothetical protein
MSIRSCCCHTKFFRHAIILGPHETSKAKPFIGYGSHQRPPRRAPARHPPPPRLSSHRRAHQRSLPPLAPRLGRAARPRLRQRRRRRRAAAAGLVPGLRRRRRPRLQPTAPRPSGDSISPCLSAAAPSRPAASPRSAWCGRFVSMRLGYARLILVESRRSCSPPVIERKISRSLLDTDGGSSSRSGRPVCSWL